MPAAAPVSAPPGHRGLELVGVTKRFGDTAALDDVCLEISPGRLVGFLGPNGAGKTTAMRAIFGLVEPDAGTVLWNGRELGLAEPLRFGYMPEERGLYPRMRLGEQPSHFAALHGRTPAAARAAVSRRWLERLGLADRAGARISRMATSSAPSWRRRSFTSPNYWCLTNPSPDSISSPPARWPRCSTRRRPAARRCSFPATSSNWWRTSAMLHGGPGLGARAAWRLAHRSPR